jgi:hypothetical protein
MLAGGKSGDLFRFSEQIMASTSEHVSPDGGNALDGPGGRFAIPAEGDTIRAHLAREADGGYGVLYPNGLAVANGAKK